MIGSVYQVMVCAMYTFATLMGETHYHDTRTDK